MARKRRSFAAGTLRSAALLFGLCAATFTAGAHAIVKESTPSAGSVVTGPEITIRLRFNSRVDPAHSRLSLADKSGARPVTIDKGSSADSLLGKAVGVKPGVYRIQWQVLATDGHITRGELPFTVR